jgi:hypothetical protein
MWNTIRNWMKLNARATPLCVAQADAPLVNLWDAPACWRRERSGDRLL